MDLELNAAITRLPRSVGWRPFMWAKQNEWQRQRQRIRANQSCDDFVGCAPASNPSFWQGKRRKRVPIQREIRSASLPRIVTPRTIVGEFRCATRTVRLPKSCSHYSLLSTRGGFYAPPLPTLVAPVL